MTNYDMNTDEGFKNAVLWTQRTVAMLNDEGVWHIPRSNAIIVFNKPKKEATYNTAALEKEEAVLTILHLLGYSLKQMVN